MVVYQDLPPSSRVWIYQSNRLLTAEETEQARRQAQQFVAQWQSHGKPVRAWADILHHLFLVFIVDEAYEAPSGCSIDSSVALVRDLGQALGVDWFDRMTFSYQTPDQQVAVAVREQFAELYANGTINDQTTVFNNLVQTKTDMEQTWRVPLAESWHANMV